MSIKVNILTDFFGDGLKKAQKEFQQLEGVSAKAGFALKKAMVPATAAVGALAAGLGSAVKASIADERASRELARSLKQTTGATDAIVASTEEWISQQGRLLGVTDDELRPALSKLARATGDVTEAQKLVSQAMDISAATGKPLIEVTDAIQKALGGNAKALQTLAPEFRTVIREGATFEEVMQGVARVTGGAAAEAAKTAEGRFKILQLQLDETKESIGASLQPAVEAVLPYLQKFADWAQNNPVVFRNIALAIGGIAASTVALNIALAANPFVLLAAGILAVFYAADKAVEPLEKMDGFIGRASRFLTRGFLGDITDLFGKATKETKQLSKAQAEAEDMARLAASGFANLNTEQIEFTKTTGNSTKKLNEQLQKLKELRKEIRKDFADALEKAKDKLKDAQTAFDDFAKSVSQSITSTFSFGNAQSTANDNAKNLSEAITRQTKAQDALNKAYAKGNTEDIAEALKDLAEATNEVALAQAKPMTFFDNLTEQANKTKDFGVILNRLLAAGLKGPAFQQVLDAGVDLGTQLGNELLNGGVEAIATANTLAQEVQTLADNVGLSAAAQFKQAGIDAGQAMVNGINEEISKFKVTLKSKNLSKKQLKKLRQDFGLTVDFVMSGGNIPALADGGIVTGPTLALIGEAGPEAVVPLDQYGSAGTGQTNVTINVNGGDPQSVVDALRRYMQINGAVPIRIA